MCVFSHDIYLELISIADSELERIKGTIPDDTSLCFIFFLETTRMYDFLHFGPKQEVEQYGLSFQEIDVLKSGWNLTASFLFKSIKDFSGLPLMESTRETKLLSIRLMYQLGCVTLLKRTAEMVKSGLLIVDSRECNFYRFSMSNNSKAQFLDQMENYYLETLEEKLNLNKEKFYEKWELIDYENINVTFRNYGNFLSKSPKERFLNLNLDDLESKMNPLIKPWNSDKGIMIGYDSIEELDWHFLAIAARAMLEWKEEAGLHPDLNIKGISISDIITVVTCLVSFNLKHIKFSSIAAEKHKEILIFPSLTIWCSRSELVNSISNFTGINLEFVEKIFKIISFKTEDVLLLRKHTTKFMPLIIDLENDFVVRPVSSIIRNPLNTIKDLLMLRNPELITDFLKSRESWLRNYLYALFAGTRYQRVEGNIVLRINKKFITDIDAAIYDNITGELALFQIKWQDFHINDVKKLRSKARNLTEELEKWTRRVCEWISSQGVSQLTKTLRLADRKKIAESKFIYLDFLKMQLE